jgi:predicted O-methyltransferase YrrM
VRRAIGRLVREVAARSVVIYDRMPCMFNPNQLHFFVQQLDATRDVGGGILEVGCAYGATTVFLKRHMIAEGIEKRYICVDTFNGFTHADVAYERARRGKAYRYDDFTANSKRRFERTLRLNHISGVEVERCDIHDFDVSAFAPFAFCLLDVDLYRPTAGALPRLWEALSPGGVLVVDDCDPDPYDDTFDGSGAAFREFASEIEKPAHVVWGKLGVLRKPVTS